MLFIAKIGLWKTLHTIFYMLLNIYDNNSHIAFSDELRQSSPVERDSTSNFNIARRLFVYNMHHGHAWIFKYLSKLDLDANEDAENVKFVNCFCCCHYSAIFCDLLVWKSKRSSGVFTNRMRTAEKPIWHWWILSGSKSHAKVFVGQKNSSRNYLDFCFITLTSNNWKSLISHG